MKNKYPTELYKGIERTKIPLSLDSPKIGIKTFNEKLSYMSDNLDLTQPDIKKIRVISPSQSSIFYSPQRTNDFSLSHTGYFYSVFTKKVK